jgi:acyl-CoA thioester hydrolase
VAAQNRPLEIELHVPVRTYDVDYAGIVSNIVYIRWLEDLRIAMLDRYLPLEELHGRGVTPVLLRTDIRYRRAIRLFDDVVAAMWLSDVSRARWTVGAAFTVGGATCAEARQEVAVVDRESFRPRPVPEEIRRLSAQGLADTLSHPRSHQL